jgi:hypothetical protein
MATATGTCSAGMNLPTLPTGWTYGCASTSTYRNTDGSGWIPVNFKGMSEGSPFPQLPKDPLNQTSTRNYYTYTTNGTQWELTSPMESQKYKLGGASDTVGPDGGTLATVYEKGSKLGLEPLDYGDISLIGFWTFQEGAGTVVYDYSGNNATGSWSGTQAGTNGYYGPGRVRNWAGYFATTTIATLNSATSTNPINGSQATIALWESTSYVGSNEGLMAKGGVGYGFDICQNATINFRSSTTGLGNTDHNYSLDLRNGSWQFLVWTIDGSNVRLYVNGSFMGMWSMGYLNFTSNNVLGMGGNGQSCGSYFGALDGVRIYNRALSAAEVQAIYSGGK